MFAPETALFTVREHFKVASLDGFGLKDRTAAIGAAGAVLHYLTQHLRRDVANLTRISFYQRSDYLALDFTTLRHLEILEPLHHDAPRNASLYGALNRTVTPMGARRLRDWLSQPLATVEPIRRRQEAVQTFVDDAAGLEALRAQLGAGAGPGADARPAERGDRERAGPDRAAAGAGTDSSFEESAARVGGRRRIGAGQVRRAEGGGRSLRQSLLTSAATGEGRGAVERSPYLLAGAGGAGHGIAGPGGVDRAGDRG